MDGAGADSDKASWKALQVAWNFGVDPATVNDYHVYVSVDGAAAEYLGQTGSGEVPYFWWTGTKEFRIASKFQNGPEGGHNYKFTVYLVPVTGSAQNLTSGSVMFSVQ